MALAALILLSWAVIFPAEKQIYVISIEGTINPVTEDYLTSGINAASSAKAQCLIITLNTSGGLLSSTRNIVSSILRSPIPVIIYVSPEGAQAASAGVFITLSAHIAAMAPGTNIGAAHPVVLQGQADSIMMQKATNDAAAFIKSISLKRNRNVQWAENAVRKSLSLTEIEAVDSNVIDFVSGNLDALLQKLNGVEVETLKGRSVINTENFRLVYFDMTFRQKMLKVITNPDIAYILFILGLFGLMFELYNPGSIFPGVIGVISLLVAFYALRTLPVNYVGIGLIILSVILFILEIKIVSHGMLSVGGIISLVLGSIMLFDTSSVLEVLVISGEIIIFVAFMTTIFFLFVIGMGIKAQKLKTSTGQDGMINEVGVAASELNPRGQIYVHGELWFAESIDGNINKGEMVVVVNIFNMELKVKKQIKNDKLI